MIKFIVYCGALCFVHNCYNNMIFPVLHFNMLTTFNELF